MQTPMEVDPPPKADPPSRGRPSLRRHATSVQRQTLPPKADPPSKGRPLISKGRPHCGQTRMCKTLPSRNFVWAVIIYCWVKRTVGNHAPQQWFKIEDLNTHYWCWWIAGDNWEMSNIGDGIFHVLRKTFCQNCQPSILVGKQCLYVTNIFIMIDLHGKYFFNI